MGALFDLAARTDTPWLPWTALTALGLGCAGALVGLRRTGQLRPAPPASPTPAPA
ncbi:hypothetical protein [Streptomyces sp. NBC_01104]|uniref:hypothetical protein n=1 Tax=Streptomyces sp. NBC_01104 TaxID=2903750 RepID=UPI00386F9BDD